MDTMDSFEEQFCRLCLSTVSDEHFKEINDVTKRIFDVLLLKLNLDDNSKYIMCKVCSRRVMEAFRFKSMCVHTDNTIIPYVDDETDCSFDLKEIYLKETTKEHLSPTLEDCKVCQLCLQPVKDKFISAQEMAVDMIEIYIPEINLTVIEDPVICKRCFDCFVSHSNFITNCIEVNKKMKGFCDPEVVDDSTWMPTVDSYIKIEEVDIKSENDQGDQWLETDSAMVRSVYEGISYKINDSEIKAEDEDQKSEAAPVTDTVPADSYKDTYDGRGSHRLKTDMRRHKYISRLQRDACDFGIKRKSDLRRHKNLSETKAFECDRCDFKTKYRPSFKNHQLTHNDISEGKVFDCDRCDFKTRYKNSFTRHQRFHEAMSKTEEYECDTCDYKTKVKWYLKKHQQIHNALSEMEVFACDTCYYKTNRKSSLKIHQLRHKDISETEVFECGTCDYKTKRKGNLREHLLTHKNFSETEVFKCDTCEFKTKYKYNLQQHQLRHKDVSERITEIFVCYTCNYKTKRKNALRNHIMSEMKRVFECETCDFKTKDQNSLEGHKLIHTDISEREVFGCYTCDFKTRYKDSIKKHQLTHKDISEMEVFKCDKCDYKTKYKRNLKSHQPIHKDITETQAFECHTCGNKFKWKYRLRKHIQVKHRDPKL